MQRVRKRNTRKELLGRGGEMGQDMKMLEKRDRSFPPINTHVLHPILPPLKVMMLHIPLVKKAAGLIFCYSIF